ncbi:hypothetical protein OBBRIDRAFT_796286 [Obba rivulosa]|uniref:Uncharacterized protein n=1 Tax=Obba rivulosa TaxID=1052685 RepID=A0A8E2DHV1_9APHY|nr:hypothetical protein OBBRIDRAFT_796286 [Obba rivulosa]
MLSGGILPIYRAGFRCNVVELKIDASQSFGGLAEVAGFRTEILKRILSEICPCKVHLRIDWAMRGYRQPDLTAGDWAKFDDLFRDAPKGISDLALQFTVDLNVPLNEYLTRILSMCAPLRVNRLEVHMNAPDIFVRYRNGGVGGQGYLRRVMRGMDIPLFARQTAQHIPTLCVFVLGLPPGLKSQWRIARSHFGDVRLDQVEL